MSEKDCKYVSSRGLLKSCDFHSDNPVSGITVMKDYSFEKFHTLKNIKNPTIYICGHALMHFLVHLLPVIDFQFVLISGDCDETTPYETFNSEESYLQLLNNQYLIRWYCQNVVTKHNKLTVMPIGLDYHTMVNNDIWGEKQTPYEQENTLKTILNGSRHFSQRKIKCYANFHFLTNTKYGSDRVCAINEIPKSVVVYENYKIPRNETWRKQTEYAFVISPHGNGLDCHRTWEALALGCIPIVKKSPIDELYQGLPVLIVNEWREVTQELLDDTVNKFQKKSFNMEKMKLEYWVNKFKST